MLYGLSSIESSFAYHVAQGPNSWTHPDQPALTVARAVLNAMEGFLWKWIRGAGLAYGASISHDIESGLISYRVSVASNHASRCAKSSDHVNRSFRKIFKSPDSYAAFTAAQSLIDQLVSGKVRSFVTVSCRAPTDFVSSTDRD